MAMRHMKYPYTWSAKLVQFPTKFYFNNSMQFKYLCYSAIVCAPIFYWIEKKSKSPENIAKWAEIRRKELEPHRH